MAIQASSHLGGIVTYRHSSSRFPIFGTELLINPHGPKKCGNTTLGCPPFFINMGGHPLLKTSLLENPGAETGKEKYDADAQSQWRRCLINHVNTYIDTHIHIYIYMCMYVYIYIEEIQGTEPPKSRKSPKFMIEQMQCPYFSLIKQLHFQKL